jgi:Bacterial tandem repeat domain 1
MAGTSLLCLASISLSTEPARAQPNRYAEDWALLQDLLKWASGTWDFVNGAKTAITFLTGINDSRRPPTIEQIRGTITGALLEVRANELAERVAALVQILHEVETEATGRALRAMMNGQSPESIMATDFGTSYLPARMAHLQNESVFVFTSIQSILDTPANSRSVGYEQERRVVAVLPAFMVLVPLRASCMKMIGEISPWLKDAEARLIAEMLQSAGASLFRAVGTYSISFSDQENRRNGFPVYTAVWGRSTEDETQVYGVTYQEYLANYNELWDQGWRLKLLSAYVVGGEVRYTAVWGRSTEDETQVYGWTYEDYRAKYNELWDQGWRLKLLSAYVVGGEVRYTPVGLDNAFMFKKPLYSYYHRLSSGTLNTYPALRFSQYQTGALVSAVLDSLQMIKDSLWRMRHNMLVVDANKVWVPNPYTDPNAPSSKPKFRNVAGALISHIRTCDLADVSCPRIQGQGQ